MQTVFRHHSARRFWAFTLAGLAALTGLCLAWASGPAAYAMPATPGATTPANAVHSPQSSAAAVALAALSPDAPQAEADWAAKVVYLTNQQRAAGGLTPLKASTNLAAAALGHSQDMATNNFFDHVGTGGSTMQSRVEAAGYTGWTALAENIAAGYTSPQAVVDGWMNSSGHRANIMNGSLRELGVGYAYDGSAGDAYHHYWTQDFGTRSNVYPVVINQEAPTTSSRSVTLYIYGQGWAQQMRVANTSDFAGAAWEPYSSSKSWTLASGNGQRTVYVQLRSAGGQTLTNTDTIELTGQTDPTPPPVLQAPSLAINQGARYTDQSRVQLQLGLPAAAASMWVSNQSSFQDAQAQPPQAQLAWDLVHTGTGPACVYLRYADAAGVRSAVATACIIYDAWSRGLRRAYLPLTMKR